MRDIINIGTESSNIEGQGLGVSREVPYISGWGGMADPVTPVGRTQRDPVDI